MENDTIIDMYKKGFSIDYIAHRYYRKVNKNNKPIKINGVIITPVKIYNLSYCRMYVSEIIYNYTIQQYKNERIS